MGNAFHGVNCGRNYEFRTSTDSLGGITNCDLSGCHHETTSQLVCLSGHTDRCERPPLSPHSYRSGRLQRQSSEFQSRMPAFAGLNNIGTRLGDASNALLVSNWACWTLYAESIDTGIWSKPNNEAQDPKWSIRP